MSGSRMSGRIGSGFGAGLSNANPLQPDAQALVPDADYVRKGAYFYSLTGVAITRLGNGDWFYAVDTTGASRTVTLPAVADEVGHHHIVKRITGGANECNIIGADGTAILDGSATHSIAAQYGVRCYFSDGEAWRGTCGADGAAWLAYSATSTAASGAFTTVSTTGKYQKIGRTVNVQVSVVITTNGTADGYVNTTVPFAPVTDTNLYGRENGVVGLMIQGVISTGTTSMAIQRYDVAYPGGDGYILNLHGSYETAA